MKKYKLIKEYPGSPELGVIYEKIKGFCRDKQIMYKNLSKDGSCLDSKIIENNPEFWEEIIEKDYEILKVSYNNKIYDRFNGTYYFCESAINIDNNIVNRVHIDSLKLSEIKIHSVKRLSDGEVFTVGDRVYDGVLSNVKITKIEIINNRVEFLWEYPENNAKGSTLNFKRLKRIKKPLFTTEDGVDIYEGDKYYRVRLNDFTILNCHTYIKHADPNIIFFSTKEAAERYILMNKPCLSINDIKNKGFSFISMEYLINLVKSKL